MLKAFEFCIPTKSTTVPSGPDLLHEVNDDGCEPPSRAIRVALLMAGQPVPHLAPGEHADIEVSAAIVRRGLMDVSCRLLHYHRQ
jgi:hypothetical protein